MLSTAGPRDGAPTLPQWTLCGRIRRSRVVAGRRNGGSSWRNYSYGEAQRMRPVDRVIRTRRALAATIATRAALGGVAAVMFTVRPDGELRGPVSAHLRRCGSLPAWWERSRSVTHQTMVAPNGATRRALDRGTCTGAPVRTRHSCGSRGNRAGGARSSSETSIESRGTARPVEPWRGAALAGVRRRWGMPHFCSRCASGWHRGCPRSRVSECYHDSARGLPAPFARLVATVRSPAYAGGKWFESSPRVDRRAGREHSRPRSTRQRRGRDG